MPFHLLQMLVGGSSLATLHVESCIMKSTKYKIQYHHPQFLFPVNLPHNFFSQYEHDSIICLMLMINGLRGVTV